MNTRDLRKILNQSLINPKKVPGIIKIILEQNDPAYFETRAIELIHEARLGNYQEKMTNAITLLAVARYHRDQNRT